MDSVTRYEWNGSATILVLLFVLVFTIPLGLVYYQTNLLRIETHVQDSEKLAEFLRKRAGRSW
jgi:hypothetical protein